MQASSPGEGGGAAHSAGQTYRTLRSRAGAAHALGEINVTPLVDVVLVLLLVFMVTAPMMSRGIDVSLPVANLPKNEPEDRITVSIDGEGRVFIGDRPVDMAILEDRMNREMRGRVSKVVYLRADERLRYGRVIAVVDLLKRAGVEQIGFAYVLPQEKAGT